MEIRIITTGGTIDKVYFDALSQFQIGTPEIANMFQEANVGFEYVVESLLRLDSLDMNDEHRQQIYDAAVQSPQDKILITHGTDTMLLSAEKLSTIRDKTIVFTGALQPARLRSTDAIFNVGYAISAVQLLPPGAYVAMNGQIFQPGHARKNRAANRFETTTNQPTNHPTNQPTNHPTNQPTNHPTNQPTNHPTNQPTNHPTN